MAGQVVGAIMLLMIAALAPPAHGRMLIVTLPGGASAAPLIARASSVLGRGPLPGSIVVRGDRAALMPTALSHGILVLGAPPLLCGSIGRAAA